MYRVHWLDPDFETTWGLGFEVMRNEGKTFVGHGGSCPGYRTGILLKPEELVATVFMSNALGVDSEGFALRMYDIVSSAIKEAVKNPSAAKAPDPELKKYTGTYSSSWGEIAMIIWEGGLAALDLPNTNPVKEITKFQKTGEDTFRRIRKDEALGEDIIFEMGPDGRPTRIKWHSNYYLRVR
jgi:hypothetical protein